jgi:hypothetical protein
MWLARERSEWDRASQLLAMQANCNRDPKKSEPFDPVSFHPYRKGKSSFRRGTPITADNIGDVVRAFTAK